MYDYLKFKAPWLGQKEITDKANVFRSQYWDGKPSPIDIFGIVEFDLKIEIFPIPGLEKLSNTSALITSDWQTIYIDKDQYENDSYIKRNNFSVAHEIGHLVLHKELYETLAITSFEDFYRFFEACDQTEYKRLEYQAFAFASRVLVPREELEKEITRVLQLKKAGKIAGQEIVTSLSDKFMVSDSAILARMQYEKFAIDPELIEPV